MLTDIVQIVMLETAETTWMKMYEYYDYLCIAHAVGLTTVFFSSCGAVSIDFSCWASKKLQSSSAKQKNSVTLYSENIAVRCCITIDCNLKLQQLSLFF